MLFRGYAFQVLVSYMGPYATVLPFGILFHLHATGRIEGDVFARWQAVGWAWALLVTAVATIWPLRAGAAELRRRDY